MKETTDDSARRVREMTDQVSADGGTVLAAFREPVGAH